MLLLPTTHNNNSFAGNRYLKQILLNDIEKEFVVHEKLVNCVYFNEHVVYVIIKQTVIALLDDSDYVYKLF